MSLIYFKIALNKLLINYFIDSRSKIDLSILKFYPAPPPPPPPPPPPSPAPPSPAKLVPKTIP